MNPKLDTTLGWEVKSLPIYDAEGNQVEGFQRLINDNNDNTLNICKSSYTPLENSNLIGFCESLVNDFGLELEGYADFKGGRKVLAYLKNPETKQLAGFPCNDYLVIGNSHDGSSSLFVGATNYLYRCENTFSSASKYWKIAHRGNIRQGLDNVKSVYDLYYNEKTGMYEQLDRMAECQITGTTKDKLIECVLQLESSGEISTQMRNKKEKLEESISQEVGEIGTNLFGLYNGVTHYTTHQLNTKHKLFGNPFGHPHELNQRAFGFCVEQLEQQPTSLATAEIGNFF